jgi:leader peptidase (prepilin peptidase)/N-methyltransferase
LVIEIIFAIGFSIIPFLAKNPSFCFGYVVLLLLTTYISLVDIKTLTIPQLSLELLFVFGLLLSGNQQRIPTAMEGLIFGLAITFIVFFFSKNGLGIGDVFLFGILGLFVGPIGLVPILVLAPAWGLCYTTFVKKQNPGAALIPFAPFLGMAGLFVYLFRLGD